MDIINPYEEDLKNVEFYNHHPNTRKYVEQQRDAFNEGVEAVRKEAQLKINELIEAFGGFCAVLTKEDDSNTLIP